MWRFNKAQSIRDTIKEIGAQKCLTNEMVIGLYLKAISDENAITRSLRQDMEQALCSLKQGKTNDSDYPLQQRLLLALIARQKILRGELSGDLSEKMHLDTLRKALLEQEHGFAYYFSGGLCNG